MPVSPGLPGGLGAASPSLTGGLGSRGSSMGGGVVGGVTGGPLRAESWSLSSQFGHKGAVKAISEAYDQTLPKIPEPPGKVRAKGELLLVIVVAGMSGWVDDSKGMCGKSKSHQPGCSLRDWRGQPAQVTSSSHQL